MTSEDELFDKLGTAGTMAFVYQHGGEADLRMLLDLLAMEAEYVITREDLEADAAELETTGFKNAASIVREYAKEAPPEREARCPYEPSDRCNYESWQDAFDRQLKLKD